MNTHSLKGQINDFLGEAGFCVEVKFLTPIMSPDGLRVDALVRTPHFDRWMSATIKEVDIKADYSLHNFGDLIVQLRTIAIEAMWLNGQKIIQLVSREGVIYGLSESGDLWLRDGAKWLHVPMPKSFTGTPWLDQPLLPAPQEVAE